MKYTHHFLLAFVVLAGATVLSSCSYRELMVASNALKTPTIKLLVTGNPPKLVVQTPGSANCGGASPPNGCIAVAKRDTALIKFELRTSPNWNLSEFQICVGGTKAGQVCNLENWQQAEFYVTDSAYSQRLYPDVNGVIDLTQLSAALTEFYLFDYNSVEQEYFYTIEACNNDASPPCIPTDPPLENGGRR